MGITLGPPFSGVYPECRHFVLSFIFLPLPDSKSFATQDELTLYKTRPDYYVPILCTLTKFVRPEISLGAEPVITT